MSVDPLAYYTSPRKLEGVIMKLEPFSRQHALVGFLCNIDNAKTLAGFTQELADAIMDYQVCIVNPPVTCNECPARFPYNKEYMKRQGESTLIPTTSTTIPSTSLVIPKLSW